MKKWGILLLAALVAMFVMVSCQDLNVYAKKADLTASGVATGVCLNCHTADATYGMAGAAGTNKTAYANSGHAKMAYRKAVPTGYAFSSAVVEESSSCAKCHTDAGFESWSDNGPAPMATYGTTNPYSLMVQSISMTTTEAGASFISCFTCHDPHSQWTMALRTEKPVAFPQGNFTSGATLSAYSSTIYNMGAGNLCVNCHQNRGSGAAFNDYLSTVTVTTANTDIANFTSVSRTGADTTSYLPVYATVASGTVTIAKGGNSHWSVQGDYVLGTISSAKTASVTNGYTVASANPTFAANPHYSEDSCVTCHVSNGDHSLYLSTSTGDNLASCQYCHSATSTAPGKISATSTKTYSSTATDFANEISNSTMLANIQTAEWKLLNYFGTAANFYARTGSGTTAAPYVLATATANGVVKQILDNTVSPVTYKTTWTPYAATDSHVALKDWDFASGLYMSQAQYQAYWNFYVYTKDHSRGIHNPTFTAELLYDAMTLTGLTTDRDAIWATRL
jgi:hypothetical protein